MNKQDLRIVFIGTPDFAVASLKAILEAGYNVVGVITAPDKPAGRGLKLQESAVKAFAREKGVYIMQPPRLKNPEFLEELRSLKADIQVVIAFRMLPEAVWNMPPLGTFNLHASLLPDYRGAAPINWAIINGEKETGVSTFFLRHEIDTGDIVFREKVPIWEDTTAGELHDLLMEKGAGLVVRTLDAVCKGDYPAMPQEIRPDAPAAPKIFREHCLIDWNKPLNEVYNLIRGMSPYPAAFTYLAGHSLKILKAEKSEGSPGTPGEIFSDNKSLLRFSCPDGWIVVKELQMEGKKRMKTDEFLRGFNVNEALRKRQE